MVRIKDMEDFEERINGKGLDMNPRTVNSKSGAFLIQLSSELLETTAHRVKRTIEKHSKGNTPIYLELDGRVISLGEADLTMSFFKELNSVLTPYKPAYYNVLDGEKVDFEIDSLISTIRIQRTYDAENFL